MLLTKRISIALLLILLFLSINHDLSKNTYPTDNILVNDLETETISFTIVQLKVLPGETFLSIMEQINPLLFNDLDIEQLIEVFISLNPQTDPYQLVVGETYYFPKY